MFVPGLPVHNEPYKVKMNAEEVLRLKSKMIEMIRDDVDKLVASGVPLSQLELLPSGDSSILFVSGNPHTDYRIINSDIQVLPISPAVIP